MKDGQRNNIEYFLKKIDYRFLIIFIIGLFLRIYSLIFVSYAGDSWYYFKSAQGVINGDYVSWRPPAYPIFIAFFILIVGDSMLAVKLASFTTGILLIFTSNIVFKRTALQILRNDEKKEEKSKIIGLLASFYISIHMVLVFNCGGGVREEFLMLLFVLILYFIVISKNKNNWKGYIIIVFLISILSLAHITTGIFIFALFSLLYIVSKLKIIKVSSISTIQMLLISFSFFISTLSWLIYCHFKFGNALKTFAMQRFWWENMQNMDLYSIEGALNAIIYGLEYGIFLELQILFSLIGTIFILLSILIILIYYKNNQILFIYGFLVINFAYLSIFIAPFGEARLLYYLFPFIFFLGFTFIIDLWYDKKNLEIISFYFLKHNYSFKLNLLFLLYLAFFILRQMFLFGHFFLSDIDFYHNVRLVYTIDNPFIIGISIIEDFLLFSLVILPTYMEKTKKKKKT